MMSSIDWYKVKCRLSAQVIFKSYLMIGLQLHNFSLRESILNAVFWLV